MGTILVLEDDPILRELLRRVLQDAGFEVLIAEDGIRGVGLLERNPAKVDLVILDLLMPNLSGDEALRLIRDTRPDLPAVVSTGCSASDARQRLADLDVAAIFFKPYSIRALVAQVSSLVDP